jgi:ferrous iron transport protein B
MTITSRTLFRLDYGGKLEREIARIIASFEENKFNTEHYPQRWLAIKLLESDVDILERVQAMPNGIQVIALAQQGAEKIKSMLGDDIDMLTADHRYGYINGVVRQALHRPSIDRITLTDRVDDIVTQMVRIAIFLRDHVCHVPTRNRCLRSVFRLDGCGHQRSHCSLVRVPA